MFYPRNQNSAFIELSQFELEVIIRKGNSCGLLYIQNPQLK